MACDLSRVLDGDQVVGDVDRGLGGVLPLRAVEELGVILTKQVKHTESWHIVEQDVLKKQKGTDH